MTVCLMLNGPFNYSGTVTSPRSGVTYYRTTPLMEPLMVLNALNGCLNGVLNTRCQLLGLVPVVVGGLTDRTPRSCGLITHCLGDAGSIPCPTRHPFYELNGVLNGTPYYVVGVIHRNFNNNIIYLVFLLDNIFLFLFSPKREKEIEIIIIYQHPYLGASLIKVWNCSAFQAVNRLGITSHE